MRLGLLGYCVNTGLGELNRQIAEYLKPSVWYVVTHRILGRNTPSIPHLIDNARRNNLEEFVKSVDTIVFCENPLRMEVLAFAKRHKKKLICIPMQEWLPSNLSRWPTYIDKFLCPTKHCYDQFKGKLNCEYFPWPVDVNRFPYIRRMSCRKFLFLNGNGGWKGRKGLDVIQKAKSLWPEMPLIVSSQTGINFDNCEFLPSQRSNSTLYSKGDILLAPHSVDGIGLEILEALASGMPVISTDGLPWNEYPAIAKIPAVSEGRKVNRLVDWYLPDAEELVKICKSLPNTNISVDSDLAYKWSRKNCWDEEKVKLFYELCSK